jgi:peptide/nickel transport system permease protein
MSSSIPGFGHEQRGEPASQGLPDQILVRVPQGMAPGNWLAILAFFVLVAILAPILIPAGCPAPPRPRAIGSCPNPELPAGDRRTGCSTLVLLAYGTRISLTVGLAATIVAMLIGIFGGDHGHFRGPASHALVGVTDWFLVIPFLPLAIVLATVLGPSTLNLIIVIGITSWAGTARLIRAQTLSIEGRPDLERARALGAGNWHQMTRHVLPNVFPLVLASTTLTVAIVILSETTLSFLGLGDPLAPSWKPCCIRAFSSGCGEVGARGVRPGICVVLVVLAFTLIGRAMERILDPRGAAR